MATATLPLAEDVELRQPIAMEQYLHSTYRPDCEFVDGHLEERHVGSGRHGLLQMELGYWFILHRGEWKVRVISELRTRVSPSRVRLPDVAVVPDDAAVADAVRVTPPLIAIEILSPDDRLPRVLERLEDFRLMGTPHIWLLDPEERVAYTYAEGGLKLVTAPRLELPDSPIHLDLPALFSALPE